MRTRQAFTLVELLVTITIIAILASLVTFALFGAQESARDAKTRNAIAKIDALISPIWSDYRTRRMPITTTGLKQPQAAKAKLDALREVMRMEMPDCWTDITTNPTLVARPAVSSAYLAFYNSLPSPPNPSTDQHQSAECLYLIVTRLAEDGAEQFRETDLGDVDEDGAREFLDGWGRPISFIRWPAGFDSLLQEVTDVAKRKPDPFDPLHIYGGTNPHTATYAIFPLIYSGGPDELGGLDEYPNNTPINDPYPGAIPSGRPGNPTGEEHVDNVSNHYIGRQGG